MDVLGFIGALNKVALFFFTVTLGFVIYEFVMFLKDRKSQEQRPTVPAFDPNAPLPQATPIHTVMPSPQPLMKTNSHRAIQLVVALIIFTIVTVVMIVFRPGQTEPSTVAPTVPQSLRPSMPVSLTPAFEASSDEQAATSEASFMTETVATSSAAPEPSVTSTPPSTPTPTVEAIVVAESSASPSATTAPTTSELPTAGIRFPYEFIGVIAASVVVLAFLF